MSVPGRDGVELCQENRWRFPGSDGRVEADEKVTVLLPPLPTGKHVPRPSKTSVPELHHLPLLLLCRGKRISFHISYILFHVLPCIR